MYNTSHNLLIEHIRRHTTIYVFTTILFLTGIVFGAILVNSMDFVQRQNLFFYLERFFTQQTNDGEVIHRQDVFIQSLLYHVKYLSFMLLLALSMIGLPIIWIMLFMKGFVVGFSVGFMVNQLGGQGLLLSAISIAPQNLLIIPIYIIAGSVAMIFSMGLWQKLFLKHHHQQVLPPFIRLVITFVILMIFTALAALMEAYLSNTLMIEWIERYEG
ncbi:stage II sporulation protein M [Oceanobacillus sp. J11TS1]|uniref:stage II sporulation protein M n=1 Tax=Oceanobacillus sp. J11TS1 TaxID=2807191 RepID=UPI001B01CAE6|nr:stage II sporulation protein M [Oceanobacillus sp. J11TS1]GIO22540.1 stage II sporulation protein M [Oceanobacillus sp. J11TS1]